MSTEKQFLVLVNPHSGQGFSKKIFHRQVEPVFQDANIKYKLVITEHPGHAREIAEHEDLSKLNGIVVVSGDGLIYEVYNGLYKRPDWHQAIQIPIGAIPGGSGNGLAKSVSYFCNKPYDSNPGSVSAKIVAKGKPVPMDIVFLETSSGEPLVSFLSVGWGIMADIDIESEHLRLLGEVRFSLWALARVVNLKHYNGRLYFLPAYDRHSLRMKCHTRASLERSQRQTICDASSDRSRLEPSRLDPRNRRKGMKVLPPLDEPLSDVFQCIEGSFLSVYAVYQPFINTSSLFAPDSELNDGIIWLTVVREGISRLQVSQFLLALNSDGGAHRELPFVDFYPVRAFRLEPLSNNTYITVDGEIVDYGPIQAEVGDGVGSILADEA